MVVWSKGVFGRELISFNLEPIPTTLLHPSPTVPGPIQSLSQPPIQWKSLKSHSRDRDHPIALTTLSERMQMEWLWDPLIIIVGHHPSIHSIPSFTSIPFMPYLFMRDPRIDIILTLTRSMQCILSHGTGSTFARSRLNYYLFPNNQSGIGKIMEKATSLRREKRRRVFYNLC